MKKWIFLLITGFLFMSFAPDKPAYKIFRSDGEKVKYYKMVAEFEEIDFVFFGELHNDPIAHWMQLELTRELYSNLGDRLVLGAEMFESDNQLLLDEYLSGLIPLNKFEDDARLWDNFSTDYKPLLQFAREQGLPFIATNIPRRYANLVYREGFGGLDSISEEGKNFIAPIPIAYDPELPGYKAMLDIGGMGMGHGGENLPKSQAVKDATMAHFIIKNWNPGNTFLHFNGAYHSDNHDGILWHILQQRQDAKIKTISTVIQESTDSLEEANFGKADFIIVVPSTMTKTY